MIAIALMLALQLTPSPFLATTPAVQATSLPKLPTPILATLIENNLSENSPSILIRLWQNVGSYPPKPYTDLEQAGLIKRVKVAQTCDCDSCAHGANAFALTEKGRKKALALGWISDRFSKAAEIREPMYISLGQYRYVPGSASVNLKDGLPNSVTFNYLFDGSASAYYLRTLAASWDWVADGYGDPKLTLDQVGRRQSKMLLLSLIKGRWTVYEKAHYELAKCTN